MLGPAPRPNRNRQRLPDDPDNEVNELHSVSSLPYMKCSRTSDALPGDGVNRMALFCYITRTLESELNIIMDTFMRRILLSVAALCVGGLLTTPTAQAQTVDLGADIVNRYVWRGLDFGNAAAIQPALSFSHGGFTVGAWGSFEMSPIGGPGVNENDLYADYAIETSAGTFSASITDFYFTTPSSDFFNYSSGGAHVIEPGVSYTGPVSLSASMNAYGADHEIWLETRYPFSVNDVDVSIALGGSPNDESGFYGTDADTDAAITKVSLSASKSIEITDTFSLPVSASYYVNPYLARSYFIFGVTL